jgi:hypothetical protein
VPPTKGDTEVDLAYILRELSRHRRWLALGVVLALVVGITTAYRPTLSPPGLEDKSFQVGAGATSIVIDSRRSTIIDLAGTIDPLAQRAVTYARYGASAPVRDRIARKLDIPPEALVANTGGGGEAGSEQRAAELVEENQSYRVAFMAVEGQPLIDIRAQAPRGGTAVELANAAAASLSEHIQQQQDSQRVPSARRVTVRQIGPAEGGVFSSGVNLTTAILATVATFIGFCLLVLLLVRLLAEWRRSGAGAAGGTGAPYGDGFGLGASNGADPWERPEEAVVADAADDPESERSRA